MGDTVSTLLFQPPPPTKLKEHKIVWLRTKRGSRIPAFYIGFHTEGTNEVSRSLTLDEIRNSKPHEGITILYSHANAEDLGSIYPWCKFLSKMLRVNLFAYDYTGYGMAFDQDQPSEEHCYADIDAAFLFLRKELQVPAQNIVLYGRSLGSGPSCYLAAGTANNESRDDDNDDNAMRKEPVGGVILHAPFLSVYRIVIDTGCTVYGDKFPNIDYAPLINSPVMVIHGTCDQIVPSSHSEKLAAALSKDCRAPPLLIPGMGHNNVNSSVRPMFIERISEYLDEYVWPFALRKEGYCVSAQAVVRKSTPRPRIEEFRERTEFLLPSPEQMALQAPL